MKKNFKSTESNNIWDTHKIDRPRSVKDTIVDTIMDAIADGRLTIGLPLPTESELSNQLGYSRIAIREAIKQLEVLGFLKIERGSRGTIVTRPDFQCIETILAWIVKTNHITLKDLHELRMIIEVEAVAMVAVRHSEGLINRLEEILDEAERNVDQELGYVDLDFAFHKEILEACPNKLLPMLIAPFDSQLKRSRKLSFSGIEAVRNAMHYHRKILTAIHQKNPNKARAVMKEHLLRTASELKLSSIKPT